MVQNVSHEVETIVNALLQVADRVVEVSKDHVITKIWDGYLSPLGDCHQYIGKKISELGNDSIIQQCDDLVTRSFALRDNSNIQYTSSGAHSSSTYSIRILAIHPDKDFLFVVIKNLSAKEEIEIVEDKWRLALDAAGDGMWDLNMQTGKIFFSPKWHDIFGYHSSEISNWDDWAAKIHPEDQDSYRHKVEEYVAGKTSSYTVEQRFLCKDGTYKWILSRGIIISKTSDGKPLRAIGTHHDINDQKIAEEALKTSKDTFTSSFDHSGIGIALISPDGKWLDVNNVICQMTGYSKEELLQLTHLDVTYPADKEIDRGLIDQMLDREIYTYTIEKRYLSREKKIVLGLLTVSLVWNSDNTPKFFITQVIDITKKKELETELKRKNTEMEAVRLSLVNKINQLEELNHIIAHNMRGPISNIQMLVHAATEKNGDPSDTLHGAFTIEETLEMVGESTESLVKTLDVMMEISQIKLNKTIPFDECDISGVIQDITRQLHATIYEKQATIDVHLEVKEIHYPKVYLESILYNFISNSLKYSKPKAPPVILITTKKVNDRVSLSVKDNGLGIDLNRYANRLFKLNQVFHTGHDSRGVGLFITRTQVESFGGSIEAISTIGKGSEFIVTF